MHRPARQLLQQHPVSLAPVALARVHRHDTAAHLAGDDDVRREQLRQIPRRVGVPPRQLLQMETAAQRLVTEMLMAQKCLIFPVV